MHINLHNAYRPRLSARFRGTMTIVLSTVACGLWSSGTARAESGAVHGTAGYGLKMTVDTRWADGFGYRPVRVEITPAKPVVADRTLTVEFLVRCRWNSKWDLRVQQDVEIEQGANQVEVFLSVPQHLSWQTYAINVFEDGVLRKNLCTAWGSNVASANELSSSLPAVLFIGDTLPQTSSLAGRLPVDEYNEYRSYVAPQPATSSTSVNPTTLPTAFVRLPGDLPGRWIDYSNLDVVCVSRQQFAELQRKHAAAFAAILEWTSAGGNLWIYGAGTDWQHLGELERLVGISAAGGDENNLIDLLWNTPDADLYGKPVRTDQSESDVEYVDEDVLAEKAPERAMPEALATLVKSVEKAMPVFSRRKPPGQLHFLFREYDHGMIVALAASDPFPGKANDWAWVLSTVKVNRWTWTKRHGLSMVQRNPDYWNFLIPGVGLAPVTEFCILISLFVLVIGPLNYWLLRRYRRIHLLVVTIPGTAAAVTLLLFGYALISDGLGTRVRARSVTLLDQQRGRAACWSRLSYYAGLTPSGGLTFPEDTAVLPLEHFPAGGSYRNTPLGRELIWGEDQWLPSGWLSSRTPTQYVTVRSRPTKMGLEMLRPPQDGDPWKVKNNLGTPIRQLLVRIGEKEYFWAKSLDAGRTAELEKIELLDARNRLRQTCRANRPALPEGMQDEFDGGIFGISNRLSYWRWGMTGEDEPTQASGRMEQALALLTGPATARRPLLKPDSYVAIVENSPEVVLGTDSAREEASLHAIFGKW